MFRVLLITMYVLGISTAAAIVYYGWDYYSLPLPDRPHDDLHAILKPGGLWGHGMGIAGSSLVILMFLYSVRKRELCCVRFGSMRRWLDLHIWCGIMGPLFITLHTAGKFGGVVSISFFSMIMVVLSGFIGRYIYMAIPRDEEGHALSMQEISGRIDKLGRRLVHEDKVSDLVITRINKYVAAGNRQVETAGAALRVLVVADLLRPWRTRKLRRFLRLRPHRLPWGTVRHVVALARRQRMLTRRRAMLTALNSVFHLWHVFHKPFAVVMIVIMFLHIFVTTLMGSHWVF